MTGRDRSGTRAAIAGDDLLLRAPVRDDRERWFELLHDPEQLRFGMPAFVPLPESASDLDARVEDAGERFADTQPGTLVVGTAEDPDRFLGTVSWSFHVPPPLRIADIGYGVHPDARRRGVATRAIRVLTRWLTEDADGPGLARVQLDHSVENDASCRVALAAGFPREGVRLGYLPLRDPEAPDGVRRHDVCLHGIAAER
jgi:RimJ/RimL family protein N-acetyltransferase